MNVAYPPLPGDTRVVRAAGTETHDGFPDGVTLVGGSPLRLIRIPAGADAVAASLFGGQSINEAAQTHHRSIRVVEGLVRRLVVAGLADPVSSVESRVVGLSDQLTVVIPLHNRASQLDRLLRQLTAEHPSLSIVVVDDGSTELLEPVIDRYGTNVSVVRNETSLGPAAARNRGLDIVRTPFVAFIDSDVVPVTGWLEPLLHHFHDPAVAVVAPRVRSADGQSRIFAYERLRSPLDLGASGGYVFAKTRIAYVPAALLVARTDSIRTCNGFDSTMRVGEDVDLIWRIVEAGYLVRYEPASVCHHDPRPSIASFMRQRASYAGSSSALNRSHPGNVKPIAGNFWSFLAWILPCVFAIPGVLAGLAVAGTTSFLLPRKLTSVRRRGPLGKRLAFRGHVGMGRLMASALWRAWLPLGMMLGIRSRRWRFILVAAAILPGIADWRKERPALDPASFLALRCLDDASYCAGLWNGCLRARDLSSLLPDINNWPGRDGASKDEEHAPRVRP